MQFFYVYKSLAHPGKDGYVQPLSLDERLLHVKEAKRRLDTQMPWLCDSITNDLKHAFGDRNNSEFVIAPDGRIVIARDWSDPSALRKDLEKLVGPVEQQTTIAELDRKPKRAPQLAASGIVPRPQRPSGMTPIKARPKLKLEPLKSGGGTAKVAPFYVKLRAEAQSAAIAGKPGKLLLGFHLDPIYDVHWNNLAAPLKYSITAPDGMSVSPLQGEGPKVEAAADSDPREFVIEVDRATAANPLVLKVDYFACNDAEGWCKAVSQEYEIFFVRDQDAGRVMASRGAGGGAPGGREGGPPRGGFETEKIIARILESDADGDGKLSRDEAPARMADRFDQMDSNGDGFVDKDEIAARFNGRAAGAGDRTRRRPPSRQ